MTDADAQAAPPAPLDRSAVARGALVGAAIAVPAGVLQNLVGRDSDLTFLLLLVTMVGLGTGGYVAGRAALDRALTTGGVAALSVYLVVQGLGIVLRLSRGETVSWIGIPFVALLSLSCGVIGGYVAFWRHGRTEVGSERIDPTDDPGEGTT